MSNTYLCVLVNVSVHPCTCGVFPFRLDAASKATTLVHCVFGGYLRSRGGCSVGCHSSLAAVQINMVTDSTGVGGYTVTIIEGCGLIRGRGTRDGQSSGLSVDLTQEYLV